MAVSNGQLANQTTFNNALVSRTTNTNTVGQFDLENSDAASGAFVENVQRELNGLNSYTGSTSGDVHNRKPSWASNTVGTSTDSLKARADALTAEFDPSSGHTHDGTDSPQIDASDISGARLRGYFVGGTDLAAVTGSSLDVSAQMSGKTASSGTTVKGVVVTAGANKVILLDDTAATEGDELKDSNGDRIYGRITEATGVWTLSFYKNVAGVETAHSFTAQDIKWFYQELFNPLTDAPVYSELASLPSDNATQDVIDATPTLRGLVSASAQSFGGVKTFADTTASTNKDTGAVVIEGGLGVEGAINAGGNIAATGTVGGSNLSGTNTGDVTLAAVGSAPNGNGASLSGQQLTLQPADGTNPGVLTAIAQTIAGVKTFAAGLVMQAYMAIQREDVASAASITALSSSKSFVKLTGATATSLKGVTAGVDGQCLVIHNGSSATLTVEHEDAGATAADRIVLPGALDVEVAANSSIELIYDTGQSRWVQKSGSGSGGGGALSVTGSRAAPSAIVAGTGIAFSGTAARQLWFVEGSGGHVDVSANPQIAAGVTVGQELILVGRNDAQTVKLEDGTGLSLNGEIYLAADSVLGLFWDGTNWVETFRR